MPFAYLHADVLPQVLVSTSKQSVGIDEEFYLDIDLDTKGMSVNGIEGSIMLPSTVSFVRAEEGKSMVDLWVQHPHLVGDAVSFSGIMTNGFEGVIDPFHPQTRMPGKILRLVLSGKNPGEAQLDTRGISITYNDGKGTAASLPDTWTRITVRNEDVPFRYMTITDTEPALDVSVVSDTNLYDGKYALVYTASDKQSGIESVSIKEGNRAWKKIESPYLLEDQSRHSILYIQAVNYSGATIIKQIDPLPYSPIPLVRSIAFIVFLGLATWILAVYKKRHAKK